MQSSNKLLFMAGSAREGSFNKKLARLAFDIAVANGIPATFADLGDYPLPLYDGDLETTSGIPDNAVKLMALLSVHAGVFIATPEYNASITPLLKNTLDWISRVKATDEAPLGVFKSRVFALGAASPGGMAGLRGLIATRQVLELGLGALVLPDQVGIGHCVDAFDDHGHLKDKSQQAALKSVVEKLARAAKVMHGHEV